MKKRLLKSIRHACYSSSYTKVKRNGQSYRPGKFITFLICRCPYDIKFNRRIYENKKTNQETGFEQKHRRSLKQRREEKY